METLTKLNYEDLLKIENEPDEEELLCSSIKSVNAEKKAQRDFEAEMEAFDTQVLGRPQTPRKRSVSIKKIDGTTVKFRGTNNSFFSNQGNADNRSNLSRQSNRSKVSKINDPMRESTMSFFKEAFSKNAAEPKATDGLLAYFMK